MTAPAVASPGPNGTRGASNRAASNGDPPPTAASASNSEVLGNDLGFSFVDKTAKKLIFLFGDTIGIQLPILLPILQTTTPPNVAPYAAGPASRPVASPTFAPARPLYVSPDPRADAGRDDVEDDGLEADEPPLTLAQRIRTLQPAPVIMTIGSIGAIVFLGRAVTSHTTPVPVLLSAGVVSCLVFGIDAGVASVGTYRAGRDGRARRALLLSLLGGVAALISAGAFAPHARAV